MRSCVILYLRGARGAGRAATVIFAGKAAGGYVMAKAIIKLIKNVARGDSPCRPRPASGRVSPGLRGVAGPEDHARGRSVAANIHGREGGVGDRQDEARARRGADDRHAHGANIEIRDDVGPENRSFGLTADQVAARRAAGYQPWRELERNADLKAAIIDPFRLLLAGTPR